jgi:uncharacterized iron-regulated membrane protein
MTTPANMRSTNHTQQYRATWRWHFFAGVIVVPFLLVLAITGLVMVYYTSVQTPLGERIVVEVREQAPSSPMQQMATAAAALPGATVTQYIPPHSASSSAQFELTRAVDAFAVDVDPYTNEVLRVVDKNRTPYALAHRIHGSLLLDDVGDVVLEVVAGLALLLIVTGPYMWLRRRQAAPAQEPTRRGIWRRWHLLTGLYSALLLCFFLLSGLAWTNIWGGKFVQAWSSFPAEKWGPLSLSGVNHAAMNHGVTKEVPWGLEQTPLPASTAHAQHADHAQPTDHGDHGHQDAPAVVNLDTVDQLARDIGFGPRYRINLPQDADGVYTISSTSMTGDIDAPGDERTVHVDRHSGEIVAEVGFADYSLMAKSMAVGIGIHQANMGWWNIAMNVLACLAVIFLCVSGTLLWWLRRPAGSRSWPVAPRTAGLPLRSGLTVILVVMGIALPLLGATLVAGLLVYALVGRAQA